jgi:hypothetical protein
VKTYIGTKIIQARPWPNAEAQDGYKVIYPDGYTSWSPKAAFEEAYRETTAGCMTFGLAIEALKKGHKVARISWNGKGMWLVLPTTVDANYEENFGTSKQSSYPMLPSICMKTADGYFLVGWLASQTDMLSEDWTIVS